ncbi:uncharacterized protein LOC107639993 [Arachis ipaensis]|uniref:uncharacterized protein LOC107639993 n=1 Tax=Arachis ipaensis TaxID=130454 RepID=UPI0007AF3793|nr:uncharacterized protein LOC107639993 [Arachis ipaensis]
MTNALTSKNKIEFIDGTILKSEKTDSNFKAWQRCNTYVVAWINLFLSPEIYQSVLWNNISYELWNDLKHHYYQGDRFRVAELNEEIYALKQGDLSVTAYFAKLKNLCEEIDDFRSIPGCNCVKCECGLGIVRQHREEDRVTKFLRGLGEQYSTVKSQVMLMDNLPSVNRILSMITQQERQLFNFDNALDAKILAASSQPDNKGYIVDNCYKKHGYPPNFKPRFEKKSPVLNCITAADNPEDENDDFSVSQLVRGEPTINEFTPE